jgi:hypothetical protein
MSVVVRLLKFRELSVRLGHVNPIVTILDEYKAENLCLLSNIVCRLAAHPFR